MAEMVETLPVTERRWMSLGSASRILQVNEATLRQWADKGLVKVFRTPGGHRRFYREDILALTQQGEGPSAQDSPHRWEELALKRIRRRLQNSSVAQQPWHQNIDEAGMPRMRLFGRRLLSLVALATTTERRRRHELLEEARLLGEEYGQEMATRGTPLTDTVEAFIFFRSSLVEPAQGQMSQQVSSLTDQVLLGISRAYEKQMGPVPTTSFARR